MSFPASPAARPHSDACVRSTALRLAAFIVALVAWAPGYAQTARDRVASARLGGGYAQMLNLAATPDLSAAHYIVDSDTTRPEIDVLRGSYQAHWGDLAESARGYGKLSGGYMSMQDDLPVNTPFPGAGSVESKWSGYSLAAGTFLKLAISDQWTVLPSLDVGVARLDNQADYRGAAVSLQPVFDGVLFNWHTNAWLVTPGLGVEWRHSGPAGKTTVRGHLAWSWISSFAESDPVLQFDETAGVYSIRAEHQVDAAVQVMDRPLHWVLLGSYAGFFGPQHELLGFGWVSEIGLGAEVPLIRGDSARRVRASASYLFGSDVHGWTLSLGLQY